MATSITHLRSLARYRANMENGEFVSPDELDDYLQDSYAELYDLLVAAQQDYFVAEPVVFSLANGESTVKLPTDFYKLLGVDLDRGGGSWVELDPFNFNERNVESRGRFVGRGRRAGLRYRTIGGYLHITPGDSAEGRYRLWYVPTCPVLLDVGTLDDVCDKWREYIVVDAAIKMLAKEESDTTVLERAKLALTTRIEEMALMVDSGRAPRVQDVRAGRNNWIDDEVF